MKLKCGCTRIITWAKSENGRSQIPLEKAPMYYELGNTKQDGTGVPIAVKVPKERGEFYISHFLTCPKATEMSRRNQAAETMPAPEPLHCCPYPLCKNQIVKSLYACKPHWFGLPADIRSDILKGFQEDGRLWGAASLRAKQFWSTGGSGTVITQAAPADGPVT